MSNKNTKTLINKLKSDVRHTEMAFLAGFILATSVPLQVYEVAYAKKIEEGKSGHHEHHEHHEREEPRPHYSDYGSLQRTPARSGSF